MADQTPSPTAAEDAALQEALAAAHTAVWGYGVVGAATPAGGRAPVVDAEEAHRDLRDTVAALLTSRRVEPVQAEAGYALPAPVLTAADAAGLAVTLEDGTTQAWTWVLDQATERSTRQLAVAALSAAELRAVGWRVTAGRSATTAFPGLPDT
jgi:Domain of unknown function (DUF4439)